MQPRPLTDLPDREPINPVHPSHIRPLLHADHTPFLPGSITRSTEGPDPAGRTDPAAGWVTFEPTQVGQYSGGDHRRPGTCRQSSIAHTRSASNSRAHRNRCQMSRLLSIDLATPAKPTGSFIDRRQRVRALVRVRSNHDHAYVPSLDMSDAGPSADSSHSGLTPRSLSVQDV